MVFYRLVGEFETDANLFIRETFRYEAHNLKFPVGEEKAHVVPAWDGLEVTNGRERRCGQRFNHRHELGDGEVTQVVKHRLVDDDIGDSRLPVKSV